jgi:cytochrome P450/NADPH-cytochrome P450 reductase
MWYNLLKHPEKFHKAQAEVDAIVGDKVLTLDHLPKFQYIDACIKETLRLNSPIQAYNVIPREDTYLLNGKYKVNRGDDITVNLKGVHHDPTVWGEDHNEFKPERFLDGKFADLPPNSWKPFGNGLRACIGRGFAEQEMLMNTALILQRFSPQMADPGYELDIKSTLTIKPTGFFMKVRRRAGKSLLTGIPGGAASQVSQKERDEDSKDTASALKASGEKANIFFGGNSGTSEGFAQSLEGMLAEKGVEAKISSLDSATENLSKDAANIIISASYEGLPPDNAKKFVTWLEKLSDVQALKGVKFSVFGVGNSDWATTFHRIPKFIEERLQTLGAESISPAGYTNVKADLVGPFDDWSQALLQNLSGASASEADQRPSLNVSVERIQVAKELGDEKMGIGIAMKNEQLADTTVGLEKQHMEVRLPEGMTYQSGDYLVIQPRNPDETVQKIMRFFNFDEQDRVKVEGSRKKFLPAEPTPIDVFLRDHVDLGSPVTKRQLRIISGYAKGESKETLVNDEVCDQMIQTRYTVVDALIEYGVDLPFAIYIDMLLPLTPRQYSISSSPLHAGNAEIATITYDVHSSPAFSGHGIFQGACSTFLGSRKVGDRISCFVRPTNVNFRLPGDTETPLLMFAAGTGIAPMRAFLQERAAIAEAGGSRKLGPALLFYGSRDADKDFLYRSELEQWQKLGIVTVYGAHSRMPDSGKPGHPKYVQDAIWEEREQCAELFKQGGKIFLCGSAAKLGQSCAEVCKKIWMQQTGKDEEAAEEWLQSVKTDRYIADVY